MDIDLNLLNYSQGDIESLFQLPSGYELQDLENSEQTLSSKLTQFEVNTTMKKDIISFLKSAKEKLKHLLIPKTSEPFIYSNPSEYFKGTINPVEKRIITRVVNVDTIFRPQYETTKSTDFIYTLPEYIKNVVSIKIAAVELPNMWYMFSNYENNNSFTITSNGISTVVVIPEGHYMSDTISLLSPFNGVTVEVNSITAKTTLSYDDLFTINFAIDSLALIQTAGWMLGFKKTTYTSSYNNTTSKYEITSESTFGSAIDHYVFVEIDDFHNNFVTDTVVSVVHLRDTTPTYIGKNIMARIPITSNFSTVIMNTASDGLFKTRDYFGPVRLERFRIRLLNKFGNVIRLTDDYSIAFEIKELYS
jgi:hypothetical protein